VTKNSRTFRSQTPWPAENQPKCEFNALRTDFILDGLVAAAGPDLGAVKCLHVIAVQFNILEIQLDHFAKQSDGGNVGCLGLTPSWHHERYASIYLPLAKLLRK
jgi:hypothetical protein